MVANEPYQMYPNLDFDCWWCIKELWCVQSCKAVTTLKSTIFIFIFEKNVNVWSPIKTRPKRRTHMLPSFQLCNITIKAPIWSSCAAPHSIPIVWSLLPLWLCCIFLNILSRNLEKLRVFVRSWWWEREKQRKMDVLVNDHHVMSSDLGRFSCLACELLLIWMSIE